MHFVSGVDISGMMAQKVAFAGKARSAPKIAAPAPKPRPVPNAFRLLFAGFTAGDMGAVEEYLVAFKGYKSHEAVATDIRRAEYTYEYTYEYGDGAAALTRNLHMMLDRIGAPGRVSYARGEQVFKIAKTVTHKMATDHEPRSATLSP